MGSDVRPDGSDPATWSDSSARAVLQLMVESVAEMVGFEVAALSVVIGDQLATVAYTGPEEHRAFMEEPDPVEIIEPILSQAVAWGPRLRFVSSRTIEELQGHWLEIEQIPTDHEDAWLATDGLLAALSDDDGSIVGILSVDRPTTGRRPDERQRRLLERYAAQAERAVLTAIEREGMVQQISHAETARRLIREASRPAHASLDAVLRDVHAPLVAGFDARGSWLQVFEGDQPGQGLVRTHDGEVLTLPDDVVEVARTLAPTLWAEQRAFVLNADELSAVVPPQVARHLVDRGLSSILGVALGVGSECLGFLALSRRPHQPAWTTVEVDSALEIGHDLGAALMTAGALERERTMVRELQQVDDYRSQLIATLSHELRTPLTVISGNLELLGSLDLEPHAERYHRAMERGADRMRRVVDDLLLLARVSNPQHPLVPLPVDLRVVARDVIDLVESTARAQGLSLDVDLGTESLVVPGDPAELDRLVGNLVSNAVKYTREGGTISVRAARRGDRVEIRVGDDGLGISAADQERLFQAFFRTSNPEALREQGTGLGLAIVATVVDRHGGTIEVHSELGEGTEFVVSLPAVGPGLSRPVPVFDRREDRDLE